MTSARHDKRCLSDDKVLAVILTLTKARFRLSNFEL